METMLGELLGESCGKLTGTRVLPSDGLSPKLEVSFQGSGKLLGVEMTDFGTYYQTVRPGGVLYGEGQAVILSADGGMAAWTGFGVGRPTGRVPAATYGVCGSFHTASEQLARLTIVVTVVEYQMDARCVLLLRLRRWTVATVVEYQMDENGNYCWKLWEWT